MALIKEFNSKARKDISTSRRALSDAQIAEVLKLFKKSDSVEFKLTVPDSDRYSAVRSLELDVLDAELQQVFFFDTRDLRLNRAGVVLRARRNRKGGDTVVKLRPVVPDEISEKLRHSGSFNVEVDIMPGTFVCSGSLKGKASNSDVHDVSIGRYPIRKLFSSEQRSLYKEHAPKALDLDDVNSFGPINVAKLKFSPPKLRDRAIVAEVWFYPDGSRILELSTKCAPDDAFQVLAETRAFLTDRGLTITGGQETKTHRALEYFSRLQADSDDDRRRHTLAKKR